MSRSFSCHKHFLHIKTFFTSTPKPLKKKKQNCNLTHAHPHTTEDVDRTHLLIFTELRTLDILPTVRDCFGNLSPSTFSFNSSAPPLLSLPLVSCGAPLDLLISSIHLPQLLPGEHHGPPCSLNFCFF